MMRFLKFMAVLVILAILIVAGFFIFRDERPATDYLCKNAASNAEAIDYSQYWPVVSEIVDKMTLDQKVGQMTLVDLVSIVDPVTGKLKFDLLQDYEAGGVYVGGNDIPDGEGGLVEKGESCGYDAEKLLSSTLDIWRDYASKSNIPTVVDLGAGRKAEIPPFIGTDTPHGNQHVLGAVLFPHNIGMAAARDPELFCAAGYFTAAEVIDSGFNWGFSPTVAVSHNPNWGRFYETMGNNPADIEKYARAYVAGMQMADRKSGLLTGIVSTAKHYLGDGATVGGIDEGNVIVNKGREAEEKFINVNIAGYKGAVDAGTGSIMVGYNAVNNVWMSINEKYLKRLFDGEYMRPHKGFVVSDQQAINKIATQGLPTVPMKLPYDEAISKAVMGGLDMIMTFTLYTVYKDIPEFKEILKRNILNGSISMERVNDAVTRILAVKYAMGLIGKEGGDWMFGRRPGLPDFNEVYPVPGAKSLHDAARTTALKAAEKSLTLLKNEGSLLPLDIKKIKYIVLAGEEIIPTKISKTSRQDRVYQYYNDIGVQSGGWTVTWQGFMGNTFWKGDNGVKSGAATVVDGIKRTIREAGSDAEILYPEYQDISDISAAADVRSKFLDRLAKIGGMNPENTVIIAVIAEPPYAEFMGEVDNPYCYNSTEDFTNGCLYNLHFNWYMPDQQVRTLEKRFDNFDRQVISVVQKENSIDFPIVTVLFSGRPLQIDEPLELSDALIEAFLPGPTGGDALANTIF